MNFFRRVALFFVNLVLLTAVALPQTMDQALLEQINQAPTASLLRDQLGAAYVQQGKYREAIGEFSTARTLDPFDSYARFSLGLLFEEAGDYDRALQCYKEALACNAYLLYFRLGHCYHRTGQEKEALACFRKVKAFRDRADVHYAMALSQAGLKHYGKGVAELETAATLDPNFLEGKEYFSSPSQLETTKQDWEKRKGRQTVKFVFVIFLISGVIYYFGGELYDKVNFKRIYGH